MICKVCRGAGSLITANPITYWNCPCCGGAGVSFMHGPAIIYSPGFNSIKLKNATIETKRGSITISIKEMHEQKKTLMAHLVVDLGVFPSVSQAKKNGWERPLELGHHVIKVGKKLTQQVEIVE